MRESDFVNEYKLCLRFFIKKDEKHLSDVMLQLLTGTVHRYKNE